MLESIELKLLAGDSIPFIDVGDVNQPKVIGNVYQPKIRDIIDIGEDTYSQYRGILLYDTDLLEIPQTDLAKLKLDTITTFDFLYFQSRANVEFRGLVRNALEFVFKEKVYLLDNYGVFLVGDIKEGRFITKDNYKTLKQLLIKVNYLKEMEEEESLEFANEMAREWYLNIKKAEQNQPKPKAQVNLQSIISAMTWRTNKSIDEIFNMTIYQLYDGYYRLFLIDDCLSIKQGIYQGTVDREKIKPNELNWAKIIKFEEN